jgi:hypothetical protein
MAPPSSDRTGTATMRPSERKRRGRTTRMLTVRLREAGDRLVAADARRSRRRSRWPETRSRVKRRQRGLPSCTQRSRRKRRSSAEPSDELEGLGIGDGLGNGEARRRAWSGAADLEGKKWGRASEGEGGGRNEGDVQGGGMGLALSLQPPASSRWRAAAGGGALGHRNGDTATGKVGWAGLGPSPGNCSPVFLFCYYFFY